MAKPLPNAPFDGADYLPLFDHVRLRGQMLHIYNFMNDGEWRTLCEIEKRTGAPAASVSAQLRNFRKAKFGGHIVERRARGNRDAGLFEYRLLPKS